MVMKPDDLGLVMAALLLGGCASVVPTSKTTATGW